MQRRRRVFHFVGLLPPVVAGFAYQYAIALYATFEGGVIAYERVATREALEGIGASLTIPAFLRVLCGVRFTTERAVRMYLARSVAPLALVIFSPTSSTMVTNMVHHRAFGMLAPAVTIVAVGACYHLKIRSRSSSIARANS